MTPAVEVLDASALLAWLQNEPGAEEVVLQGAVMNSVNWSELFQKTKPLGLSLGDRACLATADRLSAVAVTAQKVWSRLDHVQLRQIR